MLRSGAALAGRRAGLGFPRWMWRRQRGRPSKKLSGVRHRRRHERDLSPPTAETRVLVVMDGDLHLLERMAAGPRLPRGTMDGFLRTRSLVCLFSDGRGPRRRTGRSSPVVTRTRSVATYGGKLRFHRHTW